MSVVSHEFGDQNQDRDPESGVVLGNGRLNTDHGRTYDGTGDHGDHDKLPATTSGPLKRSIFRAIVQDFSPIWFTYVMNTGIIGILLHQFPAPWHPEAFNVIATVCYLMALAMFIVFSVLFILRFSFFPRQAYWEITDDPTELALLGCWPISWMTITSLTALTVTEAYWGRAPSGNGHWGAILAFVMWWIAAFWGLATLLFVFLVIMRRALAGKKYLPPLVIIPAVAVATLALTGGIVAADAEGLSTDLAIPIIIFGFVLVGIGLFLAILLISALWYELMTKGFPAPAQTTGLFVFIGPLGQCPAALQALALATRAHSSFDKYAHGTFIQGSTTSAISVFCILVSFLLIGPGAIFLFISLYLMIDRAVTGQLRWNPSWNSIIFPTGTLCTAFLFLADELDSDAFRAFTAILLVFMILVWLVNAFYTILRIAQGKLLIVREDPRVKREMEQHTKQR